MNEQLAAIKARRDAITPGNWQEKVTYHYQDSRPDGWIAFAEGPVAFSDSAMTVCNQARADADFIAAAPADVDTLLAEVTAQEWDIAGLRYYVEALERYVPEAARRVAAGEAQAQLQQHKEAV